MQGGLGEHMKQGVKWVFFDVGSTLVDERAVYEHRFQEIARQAGVSYDEVYEAALELYKDGKKGDKEIAKHLNVNLPRWDSSKEVPYPDAVPCLAALSQRYKIGIIANQLPGTVQRLADYGLLPYIALVAASAEEGVAKPDFRIFEIALERSGCSPGEAIMVGDRMDNDIIPAKQLGMKAVWIRQGFGKYANPEVQPDYTVDSLTDLCAILL